MEEKQKPTTKQTFLQIDSFLNSQGVTRSPTLPGDIYKPSCSSIYIHRKLDSKLNFRSKTFEFFLNIADLDEPIRTKIEKILLEMRRLPASLNREHGYYIGGLFDHTLLVSNFVHLMAKTMDKQLNMNKAVLTSIYHDFGKVAYYNYKKKEKGNKIYTTKKDLEAAHYEIVLNHALEGRDYHVDGTMAVLRRYKIPYDEEMCLAIIFHHGSWSRYKPYNNNKLGTLLHMADMIASQIFLI
ncbi:MAG: HD domain-containing protein [Promethearchaeota archaeon]